VKGSPRLIALVPEWVGHVISYRSYRPEPPWGEARERTGKGVGGGGGGRGEEGWGVWGGVRVRGGEEGTVGEEEGCGGGGGG